MTPRQRQKIDLAVGEFLEAMEAAGRSPRTLEGYRSEVRLFVEWLHEETDVGSLSEVTTETIAAYQVSLVTARSKRGAPLARATQSHRIEALRSFFRWMASAGKLRVDPAAGVERPRAERRLPRDVPSKKEALRLVETIDTGDVLGVRDLAIVEVLYSTGIRCSELCDLLVSDFDADAQTLLIRRGKGRKDRVVPVGPVAAESVVRYIDDARSSLLRDRAEKHLFITWRGRPFRRAAVSDLVRRAATKAGIEKTVRPHQLRHACATHMLAGGADIRHIQMLLGHSSLQTTTIYTRVEIADLRRAHRRFHPARNVRRRDRGVPSSSAGAGVAPLDPHPHARGTRAASGVARGTSDQVALVGERT